MADYLVCHSKCVSVFSFLWLLLGFAFYLLLSSLSSANNCESPALAVLCCSLKMLRSLSSSPVCLCVFVLDA